MENKYFKRTDYEEIYSRCIKICPDMKNIIEQIRSIKPPERNESKKLLLKADQGDISAKRRLIEMYLRIALKYALYTAERYEAPLDDLFSDAVAGLMKYAKNYSTPNRYSFKNYVSIGIGNTLRKSVDNILRHKSDISFVSENLDEYILFDGEEYFMNLLQDEMLTRAINKAMTTLTEKERSVLELKFGLNGHSENSPKEIAEKINCHKLTAKRIAKRAIKKLSDCKFKDLLFMYWTND